MTDNNENQGNKKKKKPTGYLLRNRKKDPTSLDSRQKEFTGPKETLEEFLARGGEITILHPKLAPDAEPGDPPARLFKGNGRYDI